MTFGLVVGIGPVVGIPLFVGTGPVVGLTYIIRNRCRTLFGRGIST